MCVLDYIFVCVLVDWPGGMFFEDICDTKISCNIYFNYIFVCVSVDWPGGMFFEDTGDGGGLQEEGWPGEQHRPQRIGMLSGLEIRGCREPRAPSNSPGTPFNFCREPKNVLVYIHNSYFIKMQLGSLEFLFQSLVIIVYNTL